jgi:predicted enzyme related to lactoylglutathione lyase
MGELLRIESAILYFPNILLEIPPQTLADLNTIAATNNENLMSTKPQFGFVIEYVRDINAAKQFYVEVLGLEIEREHPTYVQFESFAIAGDEPMAGRGEPELYWLVDDAESAFEDLSQKAEVTLPLKEMPFGKVFGIKNSDGQPRYLLEFAKNRPSQQVE